jgi:aminopeptidase N
VAALLTPATAGAQTQGAAGLGDPYFPNAGNGSYEVDHYDLRIAFSPGRGRIDAVATISATSSQGLSGFNLDFRGLRVSSVTVDGAPAAFRRQGSELTVVPASAIVVGARFQVVVAYAGKPRPLIGADGFPTGWIPTKGGAFVGNEPRGAITWFPCNDTPADKASYSFTVTVPRGRVAVANGSLESVTASGGQRKFVWREYEPMSTYLATVTTGRFQLRYGTVNGLPAWNAIAPSLVAGSRRAVRSTGAVLARFASSFGPYPFSTVGAIADRGFPGFALETQTRPLFGERVRPIVLVHELAHQWFGDAVTPAIWRDIWLNEGFATWSEWLWRTNGNDAGLRSFFRKGYHARPRFGRRLWRVAPGDPGKKKLFGLSVYDRGGLTLEALREKIGDPAFYEILRRWVAGHLYGSASTQDFISLAESVSGQQLDRFFNVWLYQRGRPVHW